MKFIKKWSKRIFPQVTIKKRNKKETLIMGAIYGKQSNQQTRSLAESDENSVRDVEKYFRPSCHSVLNNRVTDFQFFQPYYEKSFNEIVIPPSLIKITKNTIIHYFSILREAENLTSKQMGGCGTVGMAKLPFPIAYNFFTKEYQKKVSFASYLQSFKGIGHTSLIKLNKLPVQPHSTTIPYFIELETIKVY